MEIYRICEEEIKNQLDIGFLIRRILFLERTMSLMVE